MKLAIIYTIVSPENKMIFDAAQKRGVELERIIDSEAILPITSNGHKEFDAVLQRSVSYSRGLYLTYYYERTGSLVVNSFNSAKICGDKMLCSLELAKAGVPTPKTFVAFSPEATKKSAENLGFPLVMKPVMGSWARMVNRLNDSDALHAAVESKEEMGNPWQKIYYLQEHINKPGRDIRAYVIGNEVIGAMYRNATEQSGWVTNAGRGASTTVCPVTPELEELSLRAVSVADEGIYGVDLMETGSGLTVHEINHTAEFKGLYATTHLDVAGKIVEYLAKRAKN